KKIDAAYPKLIKSKGNLKEKWNVVAKMISEIKVAGVLQVKTGEVHQSVKEAIDRMEDIFAELYGLGFIFAFDEFSDFLLNLEKQGVEEVKFFLEWMRRLRQEEKIRLIITGSINIISTVEQLNFPYLINDMKDIEILTLEPAEVKQLLVELLKYKKITLAEELLDYAVDRLSDGIPFYIQLFADSLVYYTGGNRDIDDIKEIKKLYKRITGKQHKEFIDLHTRLKTHLKGPEYDAARKVLALTCRKRMSFDDLYPYIETVLPGKEAVNKLLKRLTDECYLKKAAGRYGFVSPMLADWWKNHYEWEK
ncbi:MAG: hypothetical protein GY757_59135, partial [bacterium]|nr:hypothetical protein [bacterium]